MRIAQEQVEMFHARHGYPIAETPTASTPDMRMHRHNLILEELTEYSQASSGEDVVGIADAIADLLYVVLGTAVVHGIDIQPIFEEVHRSNMTKDTLDPVTRKGGKGPDYEPPRIAELLLIQSTGLDKEVV